MKQKSGLQSPLSCVTFPPTLHSLGEETVSRLHAAAPDWTPWIGDSVTCLGSTLSLCLFTENPSSQVSNMSIVLPLLIEEVFNLIQTTRSTFPLFTPHAFDE